MEKDLEPISLPSMDLLSGKCVMGSYFGGLKPKTDVPILAQKCMNKVCRKSMNRVISVTIFYEILVLPFGMCLFSLFKCVQELELDGLVTHEVGLKEINKAFDLLLQGNCLRCIIWMDK